MDSDRMIGIYGANGFIGRHLLARLVSDGLPVRAVSRRIGPDLEKLYGRDAELIAANLHDPLAMAASLHGLETVVQLISTSTPGLQNRYIVADIRDNVIPHVEFIQNAITAGVKKYIFISSGGTIYGPGQAKPIPEDAPTNPISSHGITKLAIESYLRMYGHVNGLNYVILRFANPFGPGQEFRKGQGLIPAVLDRYAQGLPVQIIGDGSARRDYIFIDDAIDALARSIASETIHQQTLNVGSGESRSIAEVIGAMEQVLGTRFEREHLRHRPTDVDISVLDISRAKSVLGWQPRTSFRDGLARTLLDKYGKFDVQTYAARIAE